MTGTARDTAWNADREECIKIESEQRELLVILDTISSMRVTTENPHIDYVSFEPDI